LPYQKPPQGQPDGRCTVCGSPANILQTEFGVGTVVNCSRCGDFRVDHVVADDFPLPFADDKQKALASYLIREMQKEGRAVLTREFFASLGNRSLPTPADLRDNLLLWFSEQADGRVGKLIGEGKQFSNVNIVASVGAIDGEDVFWAADALKKSAFVDLEPASGVAYFRGRVTSAGWSRIEEFGGTSNTYKGFEFAQYLVRKGYRRFGCSQSTSLGEKLDRGKTLFFAFQADKDDAALTIDNVVVMKPIFTEQRTIEKLMVYDDFDWINSSMITRNWMCGRISIKKPTPAAPAVAGPAPSAQLNRSRNEKMVFGLAN
jgi:hypothetical protein